MKIRNVIGLLVVFSALSFAQVKASSDTTNKSITSKKDIVVIDKSKNLTKIQPTSKTTWSKIKDLFM